MTNRPPYLVLSGDKIAADTFVRRGKAELERTISVAATMGVSVFARTLMLLPDGKSFIRTLVDEHINKIEIYIEPSEVPKLIPKPEPEPEKPPEEEPICPPGFVVYQYGESDYGYILGFNGATWQKYTPDPLLEIKEQPSGGWWHLGSSRTRLTHPEIHRKCDLVTWAGNPCSMCDDQIYVSGTEYGPMTLKLKKEFKYRGKEYPTPVYVLGAGIFDWKGEDYYYILGCSPTFPLSNPRLDGSDYYVYRRPVTSSTWTLVATIPYFDYSTGARKPLPIGTAYVDADGIAWLPLCVYGAAGQYAINPSNQYRKLIRIDLRTGDHREHVSGAALKYHVTESWTKTSTGTNGQTTGFPTLEENESRLATLEGDEFVFTMGGLEARYDLYFRVKHEDSWSHICNTTPHSKEYSSEWLYCKPNTVPQTYYYIDWVKNNAYSQSTIVTLVIKKDGEDYWEGPLSSILANQANSDEAELTNVNEKFIGPFNPSTQDPPCPHGTSIGFDPAGWYLTSEKTIAHHTAAITQRYYIFLHPHMLDITTSYEQAMFPHPIDPDNSIARIFRGNPARDEDILFEYMGTTAAGLNDTLFFLGYAGNPRANSSGGNTSLFGTDQSLSTCVTQYTADDFRPSVMAWLNSISPSAANEEFPIGIPFIRGGVGYPSWDENRYLGADGIMHAQNGYVHGAEQGNGANGSLYTPAFAAAHRPIERSKPWSYLATLQNIYTANPDQYTINARIRPTEDLSLGGINPLYKVLKPIMRAEDIDVQPLLLDGAFAWVQSVCYVPWQPFWDFVVGDVTLTSTSLTNNKHRRWFRCIADHTSSSWFEDQEVSNRPDWGGKAKKYWEPMAALVTTYSNVLTQKKIKQLTGEECNRITEIGII